jgi:Bacterial dnaA protein helix-turn-helix
MGFSCCVTSDMRCLPQEIIHLNLRGRRPNVLVEDEEDWHTLSGIAERMLFWCGGSIHGCRCQGNELRFAVQAGQVPAGAMAHHISGAYASHLRRRHGWAGSIFKHYVAIPVDGDLFLDDLVIWLHRRPEPNEPQSARANFCWTADSAYLTAKSSTWITTERVLAALSPGGAGRSAYSRRKTQPLAPEIIAIVTGRSAHRPKQRVGDVNATTASMSQTRPERPTIEDIAHFVADSSQIAYDDMRSRSRRRAISKAKVVATVLCTRNGASVAAVARLFGCSRSTLIEMAERYRQREPQLFADADRVLEAYVESALST